MGLFDKMIQKRVAAGPDYPSVIGALLRDGDLYIAHAMVIPSAYTRGGGVGITGTRLLSAAVDAATNAASGSKHIGGDKGSIAHTLSREADSHVLSLNTQGMCWWDFGFSGTDDPSLAQAVPRAQITSLVNTGEKSQGSQIARITFVDGSYFDYRVMTGFESANFWDAAQSYGNAH